MLFYPFKNYEDFKERFGVVVQGGGEKSRKNKVLLSFYKNKELLHTAAICNVRVMDLPDMQSLKNLVWEYIQKDNKYCSSDEYGMCNVMGYEFKSQLFRTDHQKGLCLDGDMRCVRHIKLENERVMKMKAGKWMRKILEENVCSDFIPEPVRIWFCEEFARDWESYAMSALPDYNLVVGKEYFDDIYDGNTLKGDFHSCMVNKRVSDFYKNYVDASAAYLENDEQYIVARCIIFNKVTDLDTGAVYRLAERQYSTDCDDLLKQILVNKLIAAGEIDGYKKVGAGCGDADMFILNNGTSLYGHTLKIDCNELYNCDFIPYMDSFKYYNADCEELYNYEGLDYDHELTTTDGDPFDREYDDWNECYCSETSICYYHGRIYHVDVDRLDDFCWVDRLCEYHHIEDCSRCEHCEKWLLDDNGYYSDITEGYYCCQSCLTEAESDYIENNWYYSEYTYEYYETEQEREDAEREYKLEHGIENEE